MNRKGNLFDGVGIVVGLFTAAVLTVIVVLVIKSAMSGISGTVGLPSVASSMTTSVDSQVGWVADFFLIMLLLALPIASMVLAFFNNIHPLFFWAGIGVTMLIVMLGAAFGDSWVEFINEPGITGTITTMPMSTFVFSHFGVYAFFVVLIIAAGIFVKSRSQTGYFQ